MKTTVDNSKLNRDCIETIQERKQVDLTQTCSQKKSVY